MKVQRKLVESLPQPIQAAFKELETACGTGDKTSVTLDQSRLDERLKRTLRLFAKRYQEAEAAVVEEEPKKPLTTGKVKPKSD